MNQLSKSAESDNCKKTKMTLPSLTAEGRSTTLRSHSCVHKHACLQAANGTAEINSWHPFTAYHVSPSSRGKLNTQGF